MGQLIPDGRLKNLERQLYPFTSVILQETQKNLNRILYFYVKDICDTLREYGKPDLADAILKTKNINFQDPKFGNTALIYFAIRGLADKIKLLLEISNLDKNIINKAGITAYDIVFSNITRDIDIRKQLLDSLEPGNIYPAPKDKKLV